MTLQGVEPNISAHCFGYHHEAQKNGCKNIKKDCECWCHKVGKNT